MQVYLNKSIWMQSGFRRSLHQRYYLYLTAANRQFDGQWWHPLMHSKFSNDSAHTRSVSSLTMNAEQHTAPNQQMAIAPCYDDQSNHITQCQCCNIMQHGGYCFGFSVVVEQTISKCLQLYRSSERFHRATYLRGFSDPHQFRLLGRLLVMWLTEACGAWYYWYLPVVISSEGILQPSSSYCK